MVNNVSLLLPCLFNWDLYVQAVHDKSFCVKKDRNCDDIIPFETKRLLAIFFSLSEENVVEGCVAKLSSHHNSVRIPPRVEPLDNFAEQCFQLYALLSPDAICLLLACASCQQRMEAV